MSYQQNPEALEISVVVLYVYQLRMDHLIALLPTALEKLEQADKPSFIRVDA